ncbi:MAG: glycosyltransferase [Candidatus Thermoplasmatota archaeon]
MYKEYYSTGGMNDEDIVIGISALNEENTILNVINIVQEGLMRYFPEYKATMVVAAGDSDDDTVDLASSISLSGDIDLMVINEDGKGKGAAIKALMEASQNLNAEMLGLVDGDLISIKPVWIAHMLEPLRYGITEFVSPRYIRGKHDGAITKQFSYPLISTLFGQEIRQPIGGEMAMDSELVELCLEQDEFPNTFGIDTFLTFTALAHDFRISQAPLGPRFHASTGDYSDPTELLGPMFEQVSQTTFDLVRKYRDKISSCSPMCRYRTPFRKFNNYKGLIPSTPSVDKDLFWNEAREMIEKNEKIAEEISSNVDFDVIENIKNKKELGPQYWSRVVIDALHRYIEESDIDIVKALSGFWYARYVSFIQETDDMDIQDTEQVVYNNYTEFSKRRNELIEGLQ